MEFPLAYIAASMGAMMPKVKEPNSYPSDDYKHRPTGRMRTKPGRHSRKKRLIGDKAFKKRKIKWQK